MSFIHLEQTCNLCAALVHLGNNEDKAWLTPAGLTARAELGQKDIQSGAELCQAI